MSRCELMFGVQVTLGERWDLSCLVKGGERMADSPFGFGCPLAVTFDCL